MEFVDNFDGFLHVKRQWSERRIDVYFSFLSDLIFCDGVEVSEGLVHKGGHIGGLLKDFSIGAVIYKLEKLVEDFLNVLNFFKVCGDQGHFRDQFLFLGPKPLLKIVL